MLFFSLFNIAEYITQSKFFTSLNDEGSLEVHSVPATASGHHLQDMFPMTQPTHHHWTGACNISQDVNVRERTPVIMNVCQGGR